MRAARRRSSRLALAVSALVLAFAALYLVRFAAGLPLSLDAFLVPDPRVFDGIPTGRMSPWTAFGLLLASVGLVLVSLGDRLLGRHLGAAACGVGFVLSLLAGVVTLGYFFGAPLLYGSLLVPMAFSTAVALAGLGLALIGLTPRDNAFLRPLTGPSTKARLLRTFLPLAPVIVVVDLAFDQITGLNPAVGAALGTVLSVLVVAAFVSYAAHALGGDLERAQAESERSDAEFRLLAEAMPQMVWITRADGWNLWMNQQWIAYTGLTFDESLGHGWDKPFHPDDQQRARQAWEQATETTGAYSLECRLRRADGAYRWWLIRALPLRDPAGVILKWFGTCTDIHDLKVAELEIKRSEQRFSRIFQSGLVAIGIAEVASGRLIDVNDRCAEFFGYPPDEMIGHTVFALGLWALPDERERAIAEMRASGSAAPTEAAFRRKSGEVRHGLVSMEAMTLAGIPEPLNMVVLVDLTERKQLESQLLHAQKMEAVGRLAGGVAHDFNNALGVILGYTELLMRQVGEAQRGKLEQILKATQRASGLTRQLLAFSRRQVVDPKVLDLNALVSDLEKMLRRLIGEDIDLAIATAPDLGKVKVDPGQLEQVVMNLCVNARDAMPDGGLLRIETANALMDAGQVARLPPMAPGRYVMVTVSDAGCGIAKEMLPQIFEPFFTTKEEGKGTGLGLAMVYGIVKQAGGYVFVESEVGKGTTFRIYLPRVDEAVTPAALEAPMPTLGCETILLVEDESSLRTLAREILQEHGYRVIEAAGPQEAKELSEKHQEPIQLLVTDVVMPQMNGRVLARALCAARPGLKVLYMSGYTDDVLARSGVLESGTLFLEKPFTALALLGRVRSALGSEGGVPAVA
jgi:PAS domain S-box-containing protein